ncbi:hypothetical protein GDO81_028174 [Engystomops pustulosus]|uniref:Uncharacterized protein n=1 Tax=Engystomops pustulosus TaxID=76066 RepID=A0AAV6YK78_ENGPU|nr:hypothetical protein GDO81_028174 [Engystomops pustulosus]
MMQTAMRSRSGRYTPGGGGGGRQMWTGDGTVTRVKTLRTRPGPASRYFMIRLCEGDQPGEEKSVHHIHHPCSLSHRQQVALYYCTMQQSISHRIKGIKSINH